MTNRPSRLAVRPAKRHPRGGIAGVRRHVAQLMWWQSRCVTNGSSRLGVRLVGGAGRHGPSRLGVRLVGGAGRHGPSRLGVRLVGGAGRHGWSVCVRIRSIGEDSTTIVMETGMVGREHRMGRKEIGAVRYEPGMVGSENGPTRSESGAEERGSVALVPRSEWPSLRGRVLVGKWRRGQSSHRLRAWVGKERWLGGIAER